MISTKIIKLCCCLVFIISLVGCNEECSVFLGAEEIYMDINSAHNLFATVYPKNAKITYHSSDESVAWYGNGLIISGNPGTCVVYAQSGDAVSELVTVHVCSFMEDAHILRKNINELYSEGEMSELAAKYFISQYDKFPYYAKLEVDNFYIVRMYMNYDDKEKVYITTYGEKYHQEWCDILEDRDVREIPYELAIVEGLTPCTVCRNPNARIK